MQWMYTSACRAIRFAPGLSYEGVPPDQNTYVDNSCQTFTTRITTNSNLTQTDGISCGVPM